MNGKDISIIRKKYFAHPVLLNSKIEADDGIDFTISLKYAGIDWIFFSKEKFIAFINKYNKQHKFKNPKEDKPVYSYRRLPNGKVRVTKVADKKKKPVSKKKAKKKFKKRKNESYTDSIIKRK